MAQSNYETRLDIRTEKKGEQDIIGGSIREDLIVKRIVSAHNEIHSSVFKIVKMQRLTEHKMYKGRYVDRGDFSIIIEKNGSKYERIIEVEHLFKEGKKFRFKKPKIERCIRDNMGILYVHNPSLPNSHMRCFSVNELKIILESFKFLSVKYIFGGKPHCTFDYGMYDDWVDMDTLSPKAAYIKHMRKILLPQKEN